MASIWEAQPSDVSGPGFASVLSAGTEPLLEEARQRRRERAEAEKQAHADAQVMALEKLRSHLRGEEYEKQVADAEARNLVPPKMHEKAQPKETTDKKLAAITAWALSRRGKEVLSKFPELKGIFGIVGADPMAEAAASAVKEKAKSGNKDWQAALRIGTSMAGIKPAGPEDFPEFRMRVMQGAMAAVDPADPQGQKMQAFLAKIPHTAPDRLKELEKALRGQGKDLEADMVAYYLANLPKPGWKWPWQK